tara:strand:- start:810 stop:1142 length:333 start_codon:yes stop_codon:yes gene_type:complete
MPFHKKKYKKKKKKKKYRKGKIPKAIREQCWVKNFGEVFTHSCYIHWCDNTISVFNFHVGHDKPESKGGTLDVSNLKPICSRCNLSMSNNYTIEQWNQLNGQKQKKCFCF